MKAIAGATHPRTLIRAAGEAGNTTTFIIALANMPIANAGALLLTAPLMMVLSAAIFFRERIGPMHAVLVCLGFAGAILVAQPGTSGFNAASLFALAAALFATGRDLVGRTVPTTVPTTVVVFVTMIIVTIVAGVLSLAFEGWEPPARQHLVFLAIAGAALVLGQVGLFLAYRIGRTSTVAPFFYSYLLWGVLSGLIVWHELPNPLAFSGIALIIASGVAIVILDQRRGRDDVVVANSALVPRRQGAAAPRGGCLAVTKTGRTDPRSARGQAMRLGVPQALRWPKGLGCGRGLQLRQGAYLDADARRLGRCRHHLAGGGIADHRSGLAGGDLAQCHL